MKPLLLLLFFASGSFFQKENPLDALVFDFSSDLKTSLPADGWVKMGFSVVQYGEKPLRVYFKATCVESGMDLPFYPQTESFLLHAGEEQPVTLFMNEQCGKLENLASGQHSRIVRFQFIEPDKADTLSFDQAYMIELR